MGVGVVEDVAGEIEEEDCGLVALLGCSTSFQRSTQCRGSLLRRAECGAEESKSDIRSQFVPNRFTARMRA